MFKKTVTFSELKSEPEIFSELNTGEVLQIIHRGWDIKVMMTQEHYFELMTRLEDAEIAAGKPAKYTAHDPAKLLRDFDKKVKELDQILQRSKKKYG